jgi:hypothetical protein
MMIETFLCEYLQLNTCLALMLRLGCLSKWREELETVNCKVVHGIAFVSDSDWKLHSEIMSPSRTQIRVQTQGRIQDVFLG